MNPNAIFRNPNATYKGLTADGYFNSLYGSGLSLSEQVNSLDRLLKNIDEELYTLRMEVREDFDMLAKNLGLEPQKCYASCEAHVRKLLMLAEIEKVGNELARKTADDAVRQAFEKMDGISTTACDPGDLQKVFDSVLLGVESRHPGSSTECPATDCIKAERTVFERPLQPEEVLCAAIEGLGLDDSDARSIRIRRAVGKLFELVDFLDGLSVRAYNLRARAELVEGDSQGAGGPQRINWLGTMADCKKLVVFLKQNRYIEAPYIDKFISGHFVFMGEQKSAKEIGKWHTARDGIFESFLDKSGHEYLKIPSK
jgi:hypothetical protein